MRARNWLFIIIIVLSVTISISTGQIGNYGIVLGGVDDLSTESRQVLRHKISDSDIERLKTRIGTWQEGKNYSNKINGHGTGYRPPTEEEWKLIANNSYVIDKILLKDESLSLGSVDHTNAPWFPPIGNQGGEGSCTTWAVGYYMKTFQEAKEHNWNLSGAIWEGSAPSMEYQDRIISPEFIYHLLNSGTNIGTNPIQAIRLICSIGASSWEKMPYDDNDHSSWPSEEAWREAPLYRGNSSGWQTMFLLNDTQLENLKKWIALGNLAAIYVDASKISYGLGSLLISDDMLTLDNYHPPWDSESA
jgi:hypothetical protein